MLVIYQIRSYLQKLGFYSDTRHQRERNQVTMATAGASDGIRRMEQVLQHVLQCLLCIRSQRISIAWNPPHD